MERASGDLVETIVAFVRDADLAQRGDRVVVVEVGSADRTPRTDALRIVSV